MSKELCFEAAYQFTVALSDCIWEKRIHCVWLGEGRWILETAIHDSAVYKRIA